MRADYIGCAGAEFVKTPNIDQLAKEGIRYHNCLSPSPLCVPARASMLTGMNSLKNGVLNNGSWLRPDHDTYGIHTWPQQLSNIGYETIAVGKMHFYPWDIMEGFNQRIISEDKRHIHIKDDYSDYLEKKNLKKFHGNEVAGYFDHKGAIINPLAKEDQGDYWICDQVCNYIKRYESDKPFAMMVGFLSPHCPYDPDGSSLDLFKDKEMPKSIQANNESDTLLPEIIASCKLAWNGVDYTEFSEEEKMKIRQHYCALVYETDMYLGKIMATLKEKGIYEDTTIIFASDHGDFLGDYGMIGKHFFYDSAIRVPMIIRDSDIHIQGEVSKELVNLTDIYATMLHLAGAVECETQDSKVLPCYREAEEAVKEERVIFGATDLGYMVRTPKWQFNRYKNGLTQLFDMRSDKTQENNLAEKVESMETMRELDVHLQQELIDSYVCLNDDKRVRFEAEDNNNFFIRNWQRQYPLQSKNS